LSRARGGKKKNYYKYFERRWCGDARGAMMSSFESKVLLARLYGSCYPSIQVGDQKQNEDWYELEAAWKSENFSPPRLRG
jgi:hypothetical protein